MKDLGTKNLETKRLLLRKFKIEDAPLVYENWCNDPDVAKYVTW